MKYRITTIDYETESIELRPMYPPVPTGVGVHEAGRRPKYYAWGHPTKNNCDLKDAKRIMRDIYRDPLQTMLFHNAQFDLDVGMVHMGLKLPPEHRFLDTQIEAFLCIPDDKNISLKPMAERFCNMPPEERDRLKEWILSNIKGANDKPKGKNYWAGYICFAPGDLVGEYCIGDLVRTEAVHKHFNPELVGANMQRAYQRERKMVLSSIRMSTPGIPFRRRALKKDLKRWETNLEILDEEFRRRLRTPDLDVDKNTELADALERVGAVDEWIMTAPSKMHPEGQRSVSKDNLTEVILDQNILNMLAYRGKLTVSIRTFAKTWLRQAEEASQDRLYCQWNTTRGDRGKGQVGARTGRMSSTPNVQNIPKRPDVVVYSKKGLRKLIAADRGAILMPRTLAKYGTDFALPDMRSYVGGPGWWLINRDYDQQELRILAHFESGVLMKAYNDNPDLDMHALARKLINTLLGSRYTRSQMKTTGFGLIYGEGVGLLAKKLGVDVDTAKKAKYGYFEIYPGIKALFKKLKERAKEGEPFYTWGGRRYFCEPPVNKGTHFQSFEYKMPNTLIQGSAADQTKEAIIRFEEFGLEPIWAPVHDEALGGQHTKIEANHYNACMKEAMESTEFDVPMTTSGGVKRRWTK